MDNTNIDIEVLKAQLREEMLEEVRNEIKEELINEQKEQTRNLLEKNNFSNKISTKEQIEKETTTMSELSPQVYFEQIKDLKKNVTNEDLDKIYTNCLELANKYKETGQIRGLRKILFCMESIAKEQQLVKMGIT